MIWRNSFITVGLLSIKQLELVDCLGKLSKGAR